MTTYILIDASYYIFYRVFALYTWWNIKNKDKEECIDLHNDIDFVERFKKVFVDKILELPNKLGIDKKEDIQFIIGKDCPRQHIWRNHFHSGYKGTRGDSGNSAIKPGEFFKIVYNESLFESIPYINLLTVYNACMEADDCLAVTSKYLNTKYPESQVYIITSDTDYLQLKRDNTHIYNLKFKTVNTEKNSLGSPVKDLLYKIIIGDKSDNISPVFSRYKDKNSDDDNKQYKELCLITKNICGPKSTLNYVNDLKRFMSDIIKYNVYDKYKLNRRLIDFNMIPEFLQKDVLRQIAII